MPFSEVFIGFKYVLVFLLLQELSRRTGIRGFIVNIKALHTPLNALISLGLILLLTSSSEFSTRWLEVLLLTFLVTLCLAAVFPTKVFNVTPAKSVCKNGIEYFTLNPPNHKPLGIKVFLHGGGNDALFDNSELFNAWLQQGFLVITINLPGHGKQGATVLDVHTAFELIHTAFKEIITKHHCPKTPLTITGESMGGVFALNLCVEYAEIEGVDLLATPTKVEPKLWGVITEFIHFFAYQQWWRLGHATFWEAIPSFSWVKRGHYPLRKLTNDKPSVVFHKLALTINDIPQKRALKNSQLKVRIFHGLFDGIIPYKQGLEIYQALKTGGVDVHFQILRSFHLSIKKWYIKYL